MKCINKNILCSRAKAPYSSVRGIAIKVSHFEVIMKGCIINIGHNPDSYHIVEVGVSWDMFRKLGNTYSLPGVYSRNYEFPTQIVFIIEYNKYRRSVTELLRTAIMSNDTCTRRISRSRTHLLCRKYVSHLL